MYGIAELADENISASGGRIHDNGSLCLHSSTPIKLNQELLHMLKASASFDDNSTTHLNVTVAVCLAQRLSLQCKNVYELTPQSQSQPNIASGAMGSVAVAVADAEAEAAAVADAEAEAEACISYTKNSFLGAME